MPFQQINQVKLYYEAVGRGEPLILVHGSWGDHDGWAGVVPLLSESFQVVTFDRRGHSQSQAAAGPGSVRDDVADLGSLIEALGLAPAHVVGNSFGGAIALRLAGQQPDLFRSLMVHEPPLLALLKEQPAFQRMQADYEQRFQAVADLLRSGDVDGGAQCFLDTIAFGPGTWATMPPSDQAHFTRNASTFLDEIDDPEALTLDLDSLGNFVKPTLVTTGTTSPPFFRPIAELVAQALPHGTLHTFDGAGHIPHFSHPQPYVETVKGFCRQPA